MSTSFISNPLAPSPWLPYLQWSNPGFYSMNGLMNQAYSGGMATPNTGFFNNNPLGVSSNIASLPAMPFGTDPALAAAWNEFIKTYQPASQTNPANTNTPAANTQNSTKNAANSFDGFEFYNTLNQTLNTTEFSKEVLSSALDTKNLDAFQKSLFNFAFENFEAIDRNKDGVMTADDIKAFAGLADDAKKLSSADVLKANSMDFDGDANNNPDLNNAYAKELQKLVDDSAKKGNTGLIFDTLIGAIEYAPNKDAGDWRRGDKGVQVSLDDLKNYQEQLRLDIEIGSQKDASNLEKMKAKTSAIQLSYANFMIDNWEDMTWAGTDAELSMKDLMSVIEQTDGDYKTISKTELDDFSAKYKKGSRPGQTKDTYEPHSFPQEWENSAVQTYTSFWAYRLEELD